MIIHKLVLQNTLFNSLSNTGGILMDQVQKTYLINEVSQFCHLSRKQILYYEERGLISPVERNPENNYRYYTQKHISQLFIIREYLLLGYTLDEIYKLLYKSDILQFKEFLNRRIEQTHNNFFEHVALYEQSIHKLSQISEAVTILELKTSLLKNPNEVLNINIIDYPKRTLLYTGCQGTSFDNSTTCQGNISELYIIMGKNNIKPSGPLTFRFYDQISAESYEFISASKKMDVSVPIFINYDTNERIHQNIKETEKYKCVSTVHIGDYDEALLETYKELLKWSKENKYHLTGDAIEEYIIGSEMTRDTSQYVTRIMLPIVEEARKTII